jgi:hypothetical protein
VGRPGPELPAQYGEPHPGPPLPERLGTSDVAPTASEVRSPEVRYHSLGFLTIEDAEGSPYNLRIVMCLRCGDVVVAMEVARHDLAHLAVEGHIPPGEWALIDRALGL